MIIHYYQPPPRQSYIVRVESYDLDPFQLPIRCKPGWFAGSIVADTADSPVRFVQAAQSVGMSFGDGGFTCVVYMSDGKRYRSSVINAARFAQQLGQDAQPLEVR